MEWRVGMEVLLTSSVQKELLAPNVNSAEVQKFWFICHLYFFCELHIDYLFVGNSFCFGDFGPLFIIYIITNILLIWYYLILVLVSFSLENVKFLCGHVCLFFNLGHLNFVPCLENFLIPSIYKYTPIFYSGMFIVLFISMFSSLIYLEFSFV